MNLNPKEFKTLFEAPMGNNLFRWPDFEPEKVQV
jgi:hypothetical protein